MSRRPLEMIYAETFETRSEATQAEAAFKRLTRAQKEKYLSSNGIEFPLSKGRKCLVKEVIEDENTKELSKE